MESSIEELFNAINNSDEYKEYKYDLNYNYYTKECYNIIDKLK